MFKNAQAVSLCVFCLNIGTDNKQKLCTKKVKNSTINVS